MSIVDARHLDIYIRSDFIYENWKSVEVFHIIAEYPNGKRLQHFMKWKKNDILKAQDTIKKIIFKGCLNEIYWSEINPVYGSQYHQQSYWRD